MNGFNKVMLAGQVTDAGPKLTYTTEGTPQCSFTLQLEEAGRTGQVYKLFVPVEVLSQPSPTHPLPQWGIKPTLPRVRSYKP